MSQQDRPVLSDEEEFFMSSNQFLDVLHQHIVPIQDFTDFKGKPLSSIMYFYRKHKLIPFIEEGKWVQISFCELIWLRILDSLRSMSYPIKNIKTLADYFFIEAYNDNLPQRNMESIREELFEKRAKKGLTPYESRVLEYFDHLEKWPPLLQAARLDITYLSRLVVNSLNLREEAHLLIFPGGEVMEFLGSKDVSHRHFKGIKPSHPHIRLSLSHYLEEFIEAKELRELFLPQILNEGEQKVLSLLRNRKIRKIEVLMQDGAIRRIDFEGPQKVSHHIEQEIKKLLAMENYESIEISTVEKGNLVITRKHKLPIKNTNEAK